MQSFLFSFCSWDTWWLIFFLGHIADAPFSFLGFLTVAFYMRHFPFVRQSVWTLLKFRLDNNSYLEKYSYHWGRSVPANL